MCLRRGRVVSIRLSRFGTTSRPCLTFTMACWNNHRRGRAQAKALVMINAAGFSDPANGSENTWRLIATFRLGDRTRSSQLARERVTVQWHLACVACWKKLTAAEPRSTILATRY